MLKNLVLVKYGPVIFGQKLNSDRKNSAVLDQNMDAGFRKVGTFVQIVLQIPDPPKKRRHGHFWR